MAGDTPHPCESRRWEGRAVLHVDLDAFFAAVEQLDFPEYRGRPVIVGGDPTRRGVVSTCSYEARAFGVRSAMPSARAATLCPHAIWASPRFDRYHEMSQAVFSIFRDESPLVQPVSVDEAFLDVTQGEFSHEHPVAIARRIRRRVAQLGITASVGVASSKTVAKIASDHDKPDGLTVVCPGEESAFLAALPVRAMSGIGPRSAERLGRLGIRTLGDLGSLDDVTALQVFGAQGPGLVARARGVDARRVRHNDAVKSVSNERTFASDVRSPAEVKSVLDALCAKVGRRLRNKSLCGRTVSVKLRFSDFTTRSAQHTFDVATDDEGVFGPIAFGLVTDVWTPGVGLRLVGVGVSGFGAHSRQLELTMSPEPIPDGIDPHESRQQLVQGLDAVRAKFGDKALRFGREFTAEASRAKDTGTPRRD